MMEEENVDRQLRNKYRADWSRTHSEQLNRPIREEISKYRTIINMQFKRMDWLNSVISRTKIPLPCSARQM